MKNLRIFQTERVCRQQFQIEIDENDENGIKFYKRVQNTMGKGEIALSQKFLLFPQCF